jgi:nitroimidazol reductase NimA-like FMN-containing flavoprotein (pyridoxamine 5'-phosphate oxidase superfamily)
MAVDGPVAELDARFSSPGATATDWEQGRRQIDEAEVFWLSTVRPDGRPHVTPLLAVWLDDAMYFCTGPDERKAKNLRQNQHCILTTGQNGIDGLDVVVEGHAVEVSDAAELDQVANTYESKYGAHFTAPEGTWFGLSDAIRAGKVLL